MDITTCEEYVLAELEEARRQNEVLLQENERLEAQCRLLEEQMEGKR